MTRIYIRFWKRRHRRRRDGREPSDISQVESQLHGLRDAPRRGLPKLRREDRGANPRVWPARTHGPPLLGRLPRGDRAILLRAARALGPRQSGHVGRDNLADTVLGCLASPLTWPVLYQPLTAPTGLGLLTTQSDAAGFSGRAAQGSVAPRKMACRPAAENDITVQGLRLVLEGQRLPCPFRNKEDLRRPLTRAAFTKPQTLR